MDEYEELTAPDIKVNPANFFYLPKIPKDFVIVIDSNEQKPLKFGNIPTVTKALDSGDYSILGMESSIVIERKSQADFYGSIIGDARERLYNMAERASGAGFKAFVIECEESELMAPELSYSGVHANTIYATINSFEVKRGFHFYYGDRKTCALKVANWLIVYYNRAKRVKRNLKKARKTA